MAEAGIITYQEIKSIANDYIQKTTEAERFRFILDNLNGDYDYIFEVLCADILEGDFEAPERPRIPKDANYLRDDTYRVFEYTIGNTDKFSVIKVIKIKGVGYHLGILFVNDGSCGNYMSVGCFGSSIRFEMILTGYGLKQYISK